MTTSSYRLWALSVSRPPDGVSVPVGVLGMDERPGAVPKICVRWLPAADGVGRPWRARLASPPTPGLIELWLKENGAVRLMEVDLPDSRMSLQHAVDVVLEELLTEEVPARRAEFRGYGYRAWEPSAAPLHAVDHPADRFLPTPPALPDRPAAW